MGFDHVAYIYHYVVTRNNMCLGVADVPGAPIYMTGGRYSFVMTIKEVRITCRVALYLCKKQGDQNDDIVS